MRTYGEAIDVRTATPDGVGSGTTGAAGSGASSPLGIAPPVQFLWRGRLYLVRDVLAHWVELGTWWSVRGGRAPRRRAEPPSGATSASPSDGGTDTPARSVAADVGAVEREVWRVEAASGRSAVVGVYDLVRDVAATDPRDGPPRPDRWRLARALD